MQLKGAAAASAGEGERASAARESGILIDYEEATKFLQLLAPGQDAFIFAAGIDDQTRAKASKTGKSTWCEFRGCLLPLLNHLSAKQANGLGVFVAVQEMRAGRRREVDVVSIRAVFHEWDRDEPA